MGSPRSVLLLAAGFLALYVFTTTRSTLWDRDEPRFATASREMINTGQYLYPTFNGELRPDKPILIYWLMSVSMRLFGPSELACRFFAPWAAVAAGLLTCWIGRRLFTSRVGVWSLAILLSTPLMVMTGTAATTDAVLLALIVAALVPFFFTIEAQPRLLHGMAMTAALAAALLTKGPVGLLPLLTIGSVLVMARDRGRQPRCHWGMPLIASLLALGIFLIWAVPANLATDGEILRRGLGHHVLNRAVQPLEHHGGNLLIYLPYYFLVIGLAFSPWTIFLPGAVSATIGGRLGGAIGRSLLISWAIPTFLVMTLCVTKLPHYVLPLWPALALAVAGVIDAAERQTLTARDIRWLKRGAWLYGPVAVIFGVALIAAPWYLDDTPLRVLGAVAGSTVLLMSVVGLRHHVAGRFQASAWTALIGWAITHGLIAGAGLPMMERFAKPAVNVARTIAQHTDSQVPVATHGFNEPSLNFYIDRGPIRSLAGAHEVRQWCATREPGVLVITEERYRMLARRIKNHSLALIGSHRGFNCAKGDSVGLRILVRGASIPRQDENRTAR